MLIASESAEREMYTLEKRKQTTNLRINGIHLQFTKMLGWNIRIFLNTFKMQDILEPDF